MLEIIITCEHAKNSIPTMLNRYFVGEKEILASHRGYDIGALFVSRFLAKQLNAHLFYGEVSRLVADLNRSIGHRSLFYESLQSLPSTDKRHILDRYYFPYRNAIFEKVQQTVHEGKKVLHLSIHSFTPILNGIKRDVDLGLLYDPRRSLEALFCSEIKKIFTVRSHASCYMNRPYKGTSDGLVTALRKEFLGDVYIGIEIEMNQRFFLEQMSSQYKKELVQPLLESISAAITTRFS